MTPVIMSTGKCTICCCLCAFRFFFPTNNFISKAIDFLQTKSPFQNKPKVKHVFSHEYNIQYNVWIEIKSV